jgi:hypothetical protein
VIAYLANVRLAISTYASLDAEWDAAIGCLAVETEKAEAKFGKASGVGHESCKAVKSRLEEAVSVYDRIFHVPEAHNGNGKSSSSCLI